MYQIRFFTHYKTYSSLVKARKVYHELVRVWGKDNIELIKKGNMK